MVCVECLTQALHRSIIYDCLVEAHMVFGASLTALNKRLRPIVVGCMLHRLIAKTVNQTVVTCMGFMLAPLQLGEVVHSHLPQDRYILLKHEAARLHISEFFPFVYSCHNISIYSAPSTLSFADCSLPAWSAPVIRRRHKTR